MNKTAILLIVTLIAAPLLAWIDEPMTKIQWELLNEVMLLMIGVALLCFAVGELTGNVSQVDKLWSIVPAIYAWYLTARAGMDARMLLMAFCATVWGVRLTYNFSRHGGYTWKFWTGHEDYRWAHVRKNPGLDTPLGWRLFHFFFICLYQNALLLAIVLPILLCTPGHNPLGGLDFLLALIYLGLVALETLADQQQWDFQAEKKRRLAEGIEPSGAYADGFISSGLWQFSRHPNYLAEQSIWVVFFLFSVAATGRLNWTIVGCLLLIVLFQGSSNLSEQLQSQKYPAYLDYQKRVPKFLPPIKLKKS